MWPAVTMFAVCRLPTAPSDDVGGGALLLLLGPALALACILQEEVGRQQDTGSVTFKVHLLHL